MSQSHEFIGKKVRPSNDSVLEFSSFRASCSERQGLIQAVFDIFIPILGTLMWAPKSNLQKN